MLRLLLTSLAGDGSPEHEDPGSDRLARTLRDAGHEVVALGAPPSADWLVATAVQEDVDALAVWLGAEQPGGHEDAAGAGHLVEQVVAGLAGAGAGDVAVLCVGGTSEVRAAAARATPAGAGATFGAEAAAEHVIEWLVARP